MSSVLEDLERFQREFSAMMRTPLDRSSGTLRASPARYPAPLVERTRGGRVEPAERLATYNRQYWFRLFGVLHNELRTTTAVLGAWTFNELAQQFLLARPPVGHELGGLADTFAEFWLSRLPNNGVATPRDTVPRDAVVQALQIDIAFRTAMTSPQEEPLQLTAADAPRLPVSSFVWSRSLTIVDESWPLIELRRQLPTPLGDHRAALPERLPAPRSWLICRAPRGLCVKPLVPLHAALLRLLRSHTLGEALADIEARDGAETAANARRWFAEGIELGFWTALRGTP